MERLILDGYVQTKSAKEIKKSRIGVGFEKLDREVFDPEKAYDKMGELGIKWVRIQSGWARTEKEKGVYDFSWLDDIVDNLLKRGMWPWMNLVYGNPLYDEKAKEIFGAVGVPPIYNEEDKAGWLQYVKALAKHFQGRVIWYEIWNEPDLKWSWNQDHDATGYGNFAVETAKALREANPEAKIVGGVFSFAHEEYEFIDEALATGMGEAVDAVSFHMYETDERKIFHFVNAIGADVRCYNPKAAIIQGESGAQSRSDGNGALRGGSWTKLKQAKQLLRHTVALLSTDVLFTSYFSCVDMIEGLKGKVSDKASYQDYGYFGVLGAQFDEDGHSIGTYEPKPSYYALQNLAALLSDEVTPVELPIKRECLESRRNLGRDCEDFSVIQLGFAKPNGSVALAYWNATNLMTTTCESTISFTCVGIPGEIRLIDSMTGKIYRLPETMVEWLGGHRWRLKNLPLLDYPLFLTIGDFNE